MSCQNCPVPIKFSDITKPTSDLLSKEFPVGVFRIEGKGSEKLSPTVMSKLNVLGTRDTSAPSGSGLSGEIKKTVTAVFDRPSFAKVCKKDGAPCTLPVTLESTTTLNSTGTIDEKLEIKDSLCKGLNVFASGLLIPGSSTNFKFGFDYTKFISSRAAIRATSSVDLLKGPFVVNDATVRLGELFLLGGQVSYNANKANVENYTILVGADLPLYKFSLQGTNGLNTFISTYYHKFASGIETGYKATWNRLMTSSPAASSTNGGMAGTVKPSGSSAFNVELVAKFPLEPGTYLKTKLDNVGKLALSYTTQVNSKVSLTLAGAFDTCKLEEGVHRVGLGLLIDI